MDCRKRLTGHVGSNCASERHPLTWAAGANPQPWRIALWCGDQRHRNLEFEARSCNSGEARAALYDHARAGPTISRSGCWPCFSRFSRWHSSRLCRSAKVVTQQIYLRAMDSLEAKPVPGTEGAVAPFFSPDGQWLGFFAEGKLKKILVSGGAVIPLGDIALGSRGVSWGSQGTIAFASAVAGLYSKCRKREAPRSH